MLPDYYIIPKGLDLYRLCQRRGERNISPEKLDKAKMLITLINWFTFVNYYANEDESQYIQIGSKFLKKTLVSSNPKEIIDLLVRLDVIQVNDFYQLGTQSKNYRLTSEYARRELQTATIGSYSIRKAITEHNKGKLKEEIELDEVRQQIREDLKRISFRRDVETYMGIFKGRRKYHREQCESFVNERNSYFSVDVKSGRVFHAITSTPKEMREFLLIDGEAIAEPDIPSAQPTLAATLYDSGNEAEQAEKQRYLSFINSDFYKSLAKEAGSHLKYRKAIKRACYREIFFNPKVSKGKLWKAFKKLFPLLARKIEERKGQTRLGLKKNSDFAIYLQKAEAEIVINDVGKQLVEAGIPFVTVHDSIICPKKDEKKVEKLLHQAVDKAVGGTPSIPKVRDRNRPAR